MFLLGNLQETEISNLPASTQFQINLRGSTQGQLSWSLEALASAGIFHGFIATCSFSASKSRTSFPYGFGTDFRLCEWCFSSWLVHSFFCMAWNTSRMRALGCAAWTMPCGRWCSIKSLFSNPMQREMLMCQVLVRNVGTARCCRCLSGLWSNTGGVCSIGMEVVMSEEKKKDCGTLGVYLSKTSHLLPLFHEFCEVTGLSSILTEVAGCEFSSGDWGLCLSIPQNQMPNTR